MKKNRGLEPQQQQERPHGRNRLLPMSQRKARFGGLFLFGGIDQSAAPDN